MKVLFSLTVFLMSAMQLAHAQTEPKSNPDEEPPKVIMWATEMQDVHWVIGLVTNSTYTYAKREVDKYHNKTGGDAKIISITMNNKTLYRVVTGNYEEEVDTLDDIDVLKEMYPDCYPVELDKICPSPIFNGRFYECGAM